MAQESSTFKRSPYCQECGLCDTQRPEGIDEQFVRNVVQRVVERVLEGGKHGRYVPIGVSARHLHISREHLDVLYGEGYELTKYRDLKQRGEFAAKEAVTLVGRNLRALYNVRILGPLRGHTQVELARTDGVFLGLHLPMRKSEDLSGSESVAIVGPCGVVSLKEGVIRANRHIHASPEEARSLGIQDEELVKVRISGPEALILENVQVRVKEPFRLELHLDTDDANAAGVSCNTLAELIT